MAQLFANNASTLLSSSTTASSTTFSLVSGAAFPLPTGGDYFLATVIGVDQNNNETSWEVVKCTGRSTNSLTVVRAQEGTTAKVWPKDSRIELRLTAASVMSPANLGTMSGQNSNAIAVTGGTAALSTVSAATTLNVGSSATMKFGTAPVTAPGIALVTATSEANQRAALALGTAATANVGTGAGDVAAGNHGHGADYQPVNPNLTALSGVTGAVDVVPYFTGASAMGVASLTSVGRNLIAAATTAAQRSALGLGNSATLNTGTTGTSVALGNHVHDGVYQPVAANLTALAALTNAADAMPYFDGTGFRTTTVSAAGRLFLSKATVALQRTELGLGNSATLNTGTASNTVALGNHLHTGVYQPTNANLTALAALNNYADYVPIFNGTSMSHAYLPLTGRNLIAATTIAGQRSALGLGTAATLNAGTGASDVAYGGHTHVSIDNGLNTIDYLVVAPSSDTADAQVKIGQGRGSNGNSFLDLVGDPTHSSYGLRIIRSAGGPNGSSSILHRGTGLLTIGTENAGDLRLITNGTASMHFASSGVAIVNAVNNDGSGAILQVNGGLNVRSGSIMYGGTQILGPRRGGWATMTGNNNRGTFATNSITLPLLAERVKAIIEDLKAHGLFGA